MNQIDNLKHYNYLSQYCFNKGAYGVASVCNLFIYLFQFVSIYIYSETLEFNAYSEFDSIRFDSFRFVSIDFDSIRLTSIRFDSVRKARKVRQNEIEYLIFF